MRLISVLLLFVNVILFRMESLHGFICKLHNPQKPKLPLFAKENDDIKEPVIFNKKILWGNPYIPTTRIDESLIDSSSLISEKLGEMKEDGDIEDEVVVLDKFKFVINRRQLEEAVVSRKNLTAVKKHHFGDIDGQSVDIPFLMDPRFVNFLLIF